jgi:hypothetical protein
MLERVEIVPKPGDCYAISFLGIPLLIACDLKLHDREGEPPHRRTNNRSYELSVCIASELVIPLGGLVKAPMK